jgi:hypothetical protein
MGYSQRKKRQIWEHALALRIFGLSTATGTEGGSWEATANEGSKDRKLQEHRTSKVNTGKVTA